MKTSKRKKNQMPMRELEKQINLKWIISNRKKKYALNE